MVNIAIDGTVGSGKSTLAKALAKRLGYKVFDTGAVYRTLACVFKERGYKEISEKTIDELLKNIEIDINFINSQHVLINGKDYTDFIRTEEISSLTAKISPFPKLREKVLFQQRDFARNNNVVMEGRDIATNVLPDADVKFFVTASAEVRAKRRYQQIKDKTNTLCFDDVLKELKIRDFEDETRTTAPLIPSQDSIIIDTTNQTLEQTTEICLSIIKEKICQKKEKQTK